MSACQANIRHDGTVNYPCPHKAIEKVTLVCVHEHFTEAWLCADHVSKVETPEANCPTCGTTSVVGRKNRHRCAVRIVATAGAW